MEDFLEECNIVTWNKFMDATLTYRPVNNERNLSATIKIFPESAFECYKLVKDLQASEPNLGVNGMTWVGGGSKECYAKYKVAFIKKGCDHENAHWCDTCIFNGKFQDLNLI